MIKVKHFLEAIENDDGRRIWIEPIGLTKDLRQWCKIDHVMSHLGPPRELWDWFQDHPDGYDYFRGKYHEHLAGGAYRQALRQLAFAGARENFSLIHDGENPQQNTGTALYEFLSELSAYCPPDPEP